MFILKIIISLFYQTNKDDEAEPKLEGDPENKK